MSDIQDTLFRYLTLLQLIPRSPGRVSTPVLLEKLRERGFRVSARSLQRDLRDRLALYFPLICDDQERPYRWYFDRDFHCNLPALDASSALTLVLVEQHLKHLLPPAVVSQLEPQFDDAYRLLDELNNNGLGQWSRRVRAIPNGKTLIPAAVDNGVWRTVAEGLLEERSLEVEYLSRSRGEEKRLTLHPQGLVSRYSTTYLLATVNGYEDLRQFAMHRIQWASLGKLPNHKQPEFDVDHYIASGGFGYRQSSSDLTLIAHVAPQVAWLLSETPLSDHQQLKSLENDTWQRLEAIVPDDQQTLWWLMGLGANVEVIEPEEWREEILATAKEIVAKSERSTDSQRTKRP